MNSLDTNNNLHRSLLGSVLAAVLITFATVAIVGSPTNVYADESDDAIDEILITGSRIKRGNQFSKAPINTIDAESLDLAGNLTIAEAINELPQLGESFGSQNQNITSLNDGFNAGTALINLRNLGSKRTLVLVNGRRHIGGNPGTSSVDLNAIPAAMIDRIEIVTGAASAVYGADAVSGVVNVILKNDYQGVNVGIRYGQHTEEQDGTEKSFSLMIGDVFDSNVGKGSFLVSAEFTDSDEIVAGDREFGKFDGCDFSVDSSCGSSAIPGGRLRNIGIPGDFTFDESGTPSLWDGTRFNRLPNRFSQIPIEREIFFGAFNYTLFEAGEKSVNLFLEASYSHSKSSVQIEPQFFWFRRSTPQLTSGFNQQLVPVDNPFMLAAVARVEALTGDTATLNPDGVQILRRITELGVRTSTSDRNNHRFLVGINGDISSTWSYEIYYQKGRITANQDDGNTLDKQRFFAGLDIDDNGTPGNLDDDVCRDSVFVALGCTPVDIFGTNIISSDFLDYALIDVISFIESEQEVISAFVSGELFSLPAGPVGVVFGAEYREEFTSIRADEALQDGHAGTRSMQSIQGQYDVSDVFVEARLPLLDDFGIVDYFEVDVAARFSDYSTVGDETSWSIRADLSFNDRIKLRATYGTAVRAPNINELFSPVQDSTTNIVDPCDTDGGLIVLTGVTATNCAAAIGAGSTTFDQTQIQAQTVRGRTGGNPNLLAEDANTYSFGAVVRPLDNLLISVDYFNIELDNAISTFALQDLANQCIFLSVSEFCAQVDRDSSGQIVAVNNALINAATEKIDGVDVQATIGFDIGDGVLDIQLNYSHLLGHEFTAFDGGNVDKLEGQVGNFDDRLVTRFTYTRRNFLLAWSTRWLSSANADNLLVDDPDPVIAAGNSIGSVLYNDLYGSYVFGNDSQFQVAAGIKNILDEQPPIITQPARTQVSGANTVVGGIYDTRGQFIYLRFSADF